MAILAKEGEPSSSSGELPIAPMIDVVFLLLIYFMVSSTIQRQEADIGFSLPAVVRTSEALSFPDEQTIQIDAEGRAWINGYAYDDPAEASFERLAAMLSRYRQAAESAGDVARVTLAPSGAAAHQSVVKVMDACQRAGLSELSFAMGPDA